MIVAESGPYLLFKNPVSRNGPHLDGTVLYATDLGARNFDTVRAYPDRTPYLQVASAAAEELIPKEDPVRPRVELHPIEMLTGSRLRLEVRYRPIDGAPVVVPFFDIRGRISQGSTIETGPDGEISVAFDFGPAGTTDAVALPEGDSALRLGFGAGTSRSTAIADPRVRWEVPVEVREGKVTGMVPAQLTALLQVGPDKKWYPRPDYPGASLDVTTTG